jgi:hypothetical protein
MQCSDWVLVTDTAVAAELTQQQSARLQERQCALRTLDCAAHPDAQICRDLPAFPALCHPASSRCATGLHSTDADFASLLELARPQ